MWNDEYAKVPRDEIEAKALKELMGLNIELPKVRLLAILREEGGDADCAAARAFIEMRDSYRAERGEKVHDNDDDNEQDNNRNGDNFYCNNNNQHVNNNVSAVCGTSNYDYSSEDEQKNYYDPTYVDPSTLNPLRDEAEQKQRQRAHEQQHKMRFDGRSFDMTFEAAVDECERKEHDPEDGNYMLRVRSKEFNKYNNNYDNDDYHDNYHTQNRRTCFNNDYNDDYEQQQQQQRQRRDEVEDSDAVSDDGESETKATTKKKFGGVFLKTFCNGGFCASKASYNARDGSFMRPYHFVNEGVRIIRLDSDDDRTHHINLVDTSNLADDEFDSLCDEWLEERYDPTEVPDMFHEGRDYVTARAKNAHDVKLFDLYSQFELSLRKGFSLEACLTTFFQENEKATQAHQFALGTLKAGGSGGVSGEEAAGTSSLAFLPKTTTAKVKTTGTASTRYNPSAAHAYSNDVVRNMSSISREFSVSIRLPQNCTVKRVEIIRNTFLERRFEKFCDNLKRNGIGFNVGTGYHGTTEWAVDAIAETGFICPLEGNGNVEHKSGNNGWYGDGTYLARDANVAYWYSQGSKMLIVKMARGRVYKCPGMMLGAALQRGYDSHESPDGVEWVGYTSAQLLPVAVIHFERSYTTHTAVKTVTKATIRGRTAAAVRAELDSKAHGGVHLSNKERKSVNRAKNAQIQAGSKKKK